MTSTIERFLREIEEHESSPQECCGIMEPCTFQRTALPKAGQALYKAIQACSDWVPSPILETLLEDIAKVLETECHSK